MLAASGGEPLFSGPPSGYAPLLALSPVLTPNLLEARALSGAGSAAGPVLLARRLLSRGASAVIVKGGHLSGPTSPDWVLDATGARCLPGRRLAARARGTGCRFASSLATRLAAGESLLAAARFAKIAVRRYLVQEGRAPRSPRGAPPPPPASSLGERTRRRAAPRGSGPAGR